MNLLNGTTHSLRALRPCQTEAVRCVREAAYSLTDPFLYVLPTGTGKTRIATAIIEQQKGRVLVMLAHLQKLIVGSTQTLTPKRLQEVFEASAAPISFVLTDEAHHVPRKSGYAKIYEQLRKHNPACLFVGGTATPVRSAGHSCLGVFPHIVYERTIEDMQAEGWMCSLTWRPFTVASDFGSLHTSSVSGEKDYAEEDVQEVVRAYLPQIASYQAMMFVQPYRGTGYKSHEKRHGDNYEVVSFTCSWIEFRLWSCRRCVWTHDVV